MERAPVVCTIRSVRRQPRATRGWYNRKGGRGGPRVGAGDPYVVQKSSQTYYTPLHGFPRISTGQVSRMRGTSGNSSEPPNYNFRKLPGKCIISVVHELYSEAGDDLVIPNYSKKGLFKLYSLIFRKIMIFWKRHWFQEAVASRILGVREFQDILGTSTHRGLFISGINFLIFSLWTL